MKVTAYRLLGKHDRLRAAVISDLHDENYEKLLVHLRKFRPHLILVPGDVVHDKDNTTVGLSFLRAAAAMAPTFCSLGNHELKCGDDIKTRIVSTGAQLLDNGFVSFGGLVIGGLTSGFEGRPQGRFLETPRPKLEWLDEFCRAEGTHLLLCHHPEYYSRYLAERPIELILAGHAHGGQWRIFGQGIFAPGQGLFPRFAAGAYCGKKRKKGTLRLSAEQPLLLVSQGLSNRIAVPRINNEKELLTLEFLYEEGQENG